MGPRTDRLSHTGRSCGAHAEFSVAVRAADPRAKFIATGQDPDRYQAWNAAQLSLGPGFYECLSTHMVVDAGQVVKADASPEFSPKRCSQCLWASRGMLRDMKHGDSYPRMKNVNLALTENLFRAPFNLRIIRHRASPSTATWVAHSTQRACLNTLIRVADITPISDLTGAVEFGRLWEKRGITYGVPTYWALRMCSQRGCRKFAGDGSGRRPLRCPGGIAPVLTFPMCRTWMW